MAMARSEKQCVSLCMVEAILTKLRGPEGESNTTGYFRLAHMFLRDHELRPCECGRPSKELADAIDNEVLAIGKASREVLGLENLKEGHPQGEPRD